MTPQTMLDEKNARPLGQLKCDAWVLFRLSIPETKISKIEMGLLSTDFGNGTESPVHDGDLDEASPD